LFSNHNKTSSLIQFKTLLLAFGSIVLLSSCTKETSVEIGSTNSLTTTYKVKTYREQVTSSTIGNYEVLFNLSYDNQDRLVLMADSANPANKFIYSYPASNQRVMEIINGGVLDIHEDFYLNSFSGVDSTLQYNSSGDTTTEKCSYNSNKQLIQKLEYDYNNGVPMLSNTTTITYDSNGNVISEQESSGMTSTYQYYSNLIYAQPIIMFPYSPDDYKKKSLVKTKAITMSGVQMTANVTYTFDDKDRISSEKDVYNDGTIMVRSYTYY
jgi:hypothetical protein